MILLHIPSATLERQNYSQVGAYENAMHPILDRNNTKPTAVHSTALPSAATAAFARIDSNDIEANVTGQDCMQNRNIVSTPKRRSSAGNANFRKIETKPITESARPI